MYVKKKGGHPLIWYVYIIEIDISILVVINESWNLVANLIMDNMSKL